MMKSREMLARYAQGGMVDEVGQLRAAEGGMAAKSMLRAMDPKKDYRRFRDALKVKLAEGGFTTEQKTAAILNAIKQNPDFTRQDIENALKTTGFTMGDVETALASKDAEFLSQAARQAILNPIFGSTRTTAPQAGESPLGESKGAFNALNDLIQNALANKPNATREDVLRAMVATGMNEEDLRRATGRSLSDFVAVLPPPPPLPSLTETFQQETAPAAEAPPLAVSPGAMGLDQGTQLGKAIAASDRVTVPGLDTTFRASAPRTPVYDRFGRVSGYNYGQSTQLTPATGTNVFNFVPPAITSKPRSLLNLADVPGVTVDPVTGQMRLPLSASQQFARDRSELDRQARSMYAKAAAADTSLPSQMPYGAAAAFRQFAMADPTVSAQLRMRDIEQAPPTTDTQAQAARAQYGQAPYAAALAQSFDPFLASIKPQLAQQAQAQKSYFERNPDVAAEFANPSSAYMKQMKERYPTPDAFSAFHYYQEGGQNQPWRGPLSMFSSPYQMLGFKDGGEATTEDFLKKQSGGDVSRETASPETRGVSSLKGYGEGEEAVGIRRSAHEALRGLMGMRPYEETNPSEAYRIASTATPFSMFGAGMAKAIPASKRLLMMPCCDMKGDVPAAAKQLYKGVFYQTYNKQARPGAEPNMVILSAKHGFVEPTKELAPYNQKMTAKQADELSANIQSSLDQVQWPTGIEEVMLVGGKEYQKVMRAAIKELQNQGKVSPDVVINATKGEIGEQRSQLGKYLREIPEQEPIEKQDGGEVSTDDFIKKNVPRGTSEVPQVDSKGRLIDKHAEDIAESQRMLNRLKTIQQESYRRGKLPPGIQRAVTDVMSEGKPRLFQNEVFQAIGDAFGGAVGATPREPTNPSNIHRLVQAATGAALPEIPMARTAQAARVAARGLVHEPRATMSAAGRSARESLEALGDIPVALAQPNQLGSQAGVIKPKGGNWLTSGDERGLKALAELMPGGPRNRDEALALGNVYARLVDQPVGIKQMARDDAISNWIETKLSKYVKNEMATPEDPVRALAERGITLQGVNPAQLDKHLAFERELAGYPKEGVARTPEGKAWEAAADRAIVTEEAGALLDDTQYGSMVKNRKRMYPWLENLDPQTPVYRMSSRFSDRFESTGFRHLIDELTNAINPDSGLPRSLQLSPDKLQKVTVPQAVELVDKINKWRAEQKAAVDLKRSQNAATVEYKAYDTIPGTTEPNQRGLRWVELRAPTEGLALPKGYSIQTSHNTPYLRDEKGQVVQYLDDANGVDAAAKKVVGRMSLEDALKYEGETMGHCVGGYCPDVEKGRSRIYSLRDAKGEPHVTIEVQPYPYAPRWEVVKGYLPQAEEMMRARGITNASEEEISELATQLAKENMPSSIQQIKGKANRAPKDEYLPFVQDFVKSGNWSDVQDLKNAGLVKLGNKYLTPEEVKPLVEQSMRYLEQSPALEYYRNVHREYDAHRRDPFSARNRVLEAQAGLQVHPDIPYTYREMMNIFQDPGAYGPGSLGENIERVNLLRQLYGEEGFAHGGEVNVPRETSTSKQQLDKLAQVSQRKKA